MKSISALHYALILTIIIIGVTLFFPNNNLYLVSTLLVSSIWLAAFYKSQRDLKGHGVVVERVEELKNFSIELQSLVDKELALVQEDVIRIREIVGDSIGILQNSTKSINQNMTLQKEYFDEVLKTLEIDKENNVIKINVDNEALGITQQEYQISSNNVVNINATSTLAFENRNREDINKMMLALQFEDIVGQVSERVAQHVGDIRSTVDILSKLCESELSETFESDMDNMKLEYSVIKEKLIKVSAKNLAAQKNMDEGDVDLF